MTNYSKQMITFKNDNLNFDLENVSLLDVDVWNCLNFDNVDKTSVISSIASAKILHKLHSDNNKQELLYKYGLCSSTEIVKMSMGDFVDKYSQKLEMSKTEMEEVYKRAVKIQTNMMHIITNIKTTIASPHYKAMNQNTVGGKLEEYFENLPSYQEMFGNLDYCKYDDDESIFGRPAYFADIMRITEKYITQPNFNENDKNSYELTIGKRRPDLRLIPLTKKSTKNVIPYIKIVVERLEQCTKSLLACDDIYKVASNMIYPFYLPFNLHFEIIKEILKIKKLKLEDIYFAWNIDKENIYKEIAGFNSLNEKILIESHNENEDEIKKLYGIENNKIDILNEVDTFCYYTNIKFENVLSLINQDLLESEKNLASLFYINQGLKNGKFVTVNDEGKFVNFNLDVADRINRFLRLSRITSLYFDELDWILKGLKCEDINKDCLIGIGNCKHLINKIKLSFYDFMSLIFPLKTYGKNNNFDTIFNSNSEFELYPPRKNDFNHNYSDNLKLWSDGQASINWLAACINLNIGDIKILKQFLFKAEDFEFNVENLSVFYRHCLLANKLDFTIEGYIFYLRIIGISNVKIFTLEQIDFIVEVKNFINKFNLSIWQLDYLLFGKENKYVEKRYNESSLCKFLEFIWKQNISYKDKDEDSAEKNVINHLSTYLNTSIETINKYKKVFPVIKDLKYWAQAFLIPPQNSNEKSPYYTQILNIMDILDKCLYLENIRINPTIIQNIYLYPKMYNISDINSPNINSIIGLFSFNNFVNQYSNKDLIDCLNLNDEKTILKLCEITGWKNNDVLYLKENVFLEFKGIKLILALKNCFEKINILGVDLNIMNTVANINNYSDNYDKIKDIQNSLYMFLFKNPYLQSTIYKKKREILIDIVIWKLGKKFKDINSPNDVYKYLMIDVEMEEETQITYIKEGINAVQLYLQRCRLGLEKYVKKIEIDDSWWSWIMNYSLWQANRKIFVYPENYLVPSIRKSKTSLFKNIEEGLQQSQTIDGYMEKLYVKYIEDYTNLSDLDICASYYASTGVLEDTLFIFGRNKCQPYKYYYCKRKGKTAYTQWLEVEVSINSEYITPIYIFNKLYIFWVEQKINSKPVTKQNSTEILSSSETSYRVDIKYTFLNLNNEWISPQTLLENQLIYFSSETWKNSYENSDGLFYRAFNINSYEWKKVSALRITASNFNGYAKKSENFERLCIVLGTFVNSRKTYNLPEHTEINGNDKNDFLNLIYNKVNESNIVSKYLESGELNAGFAKIYNSSMEEDNLFQKNEFIITDAYFPKDTIDYKLILDSVNNTISIGYSNKPIVQEFCIKYPQIQHKPEKIKGDSFISDFIDISLSKKIYDELCKNGIVNSGNIDENKALKVNYSDIIKTLVENDNSNSNIILDMQEIIFNNIKPIELFKIKDINKTVVMPVANLQGSFILHSDNEIFLLSPDYKNENKKASKTENGLIVSCPVVNETIFFKTGMDKNRGKKICEILKNNSKIDSLNHVVYMTKDELSEVLSPLKLSDDDIDLIASILFNSPIVNEETFICKDINKELSVVIYKIFKENMIINDFNRVDKELISFVGPRLPLINLISQNKISQNCLPFIYNNLVFAPIPVSINYYNKNNNVEALNKYVFNTERLSNGSIQILKKCIYNSGIKKLLDLKTQNIPSFPVQPFDRFCPKKENINYPKSVDGAQVDFDGLYSEYNWEIFYHIPMLIADYLKSQKNNEAAMNWYQYIFNPSEQKKLIEKDIFAKELPQQMDSYLSEYIYNSLKDKGYIIDGNVAEHFNEKTDLDFLKTLDVDKDVIIALRNVMLNMKLSTANAYYWSFRPFRNHKLQTFKDILSDNNPAMSVYNNDPFNPHAIARLRIGAYEKYTIMQYIENLIEGADSQFSLDTWESITSATMLYVLAYTLLGPKPSQIAENKNKKTFNFDDIEKKYSQNIPQFLIYAEAIASEIADTSKEICLENKIPFNYLDICFGIPENNVLTQYWELVEDRLFKIRNSMNIAGIKRNILLEEKEIDVLELLRASGVTNEFPSQIEQSVNEYFPYRFISTLKYSKTIINQLISLSNNLLSVIEKKEQEEIRIMMDNNERNILKMTIMIKQSQIDEINESMEALKISLKSFESKKDYYIKLLNNGLSDAEIVSLDAMEKSAALGIASSLIKSLSSAAYAVPQVGSPFAMTYGGVQVGAMLNAASSVIDIESGLSDYISHRSATMAGYERRTEEWQMQYESVCYEVQNIKKQISSLEKKASGVKRDLDTHLKNLEMKQEISDYLKNKFTNTQLYQWMIGRIQSILFNAYQSSLQLCLFAEKAYQEEINSNEKFIQFQYWDGAKRGILAGEGLLNALNQMETEFYKNNKRKLEIEKNISLALMCPQAFFDLKSKGICEFKITEAMFDYDYPGGYTRKIANISISVPAVLGPYQNIKAILTQTYNAVVTKPDADGVDYLLGGKVKKKPNSVNENYALNQQIAISKGVNDSGMFVINFCDERYLPFEETGAVSSWKLEMPRDTNRFSFESLSDVIVNIKYRALIQEDFKNSVKKLLNEYCPYTGGMYFNLKQNFGTLWEVFINNIDENEKQTLEFNIKCFTLNYFSNAKITGMIVRIITEGTELPDKYNVFNLITPNLKEIPVSMCKDIGICQKINLDSKNAEGIWKIEVDINEMKKNAYLLKLLTNGKLDANCFKNIEIALMYEGRFLSEE